VTRRFAVPPSAGALYPVKLEDAAASPPEAAASAPAKPAAQRAGQGDSDAVRDTLRGGNLVAIAFAFLGFGLLLAFTPCVLPMVPVLSSIIVGQQDVSRGKGLALAVAYSVGMVAVYTAMGVAAGLAGEGLAAALQTPWVLATFAVGLLFLSLSMFGAYELQMPSFLQTALNERAGRFAGGRYLGVFAMGAVSALVIGPCVAAPLAGVLLYISQTRDAATGGLALLCLASGMSVPLLLTGFSAGSLLPRAGAWMNGVRHLFGLMLVATAIWIAMPVLAGGSLPLLAWGGFALLASAFLPTFEATPAQASPLYRAAKALGVLLLVLGVAELAGAALGGRALFQPLAPLTSGEASPVAVRGGEPVFRTVNSVEELDARLAEGNGPYLLDFYADWCTSCKELEAVTFADPAVRNQLASMTLLRADVTDNSEAARTLMKRFELFGPPAMILFDHTGHEFSAARQIGFVRPADWLPQLQRVNRPMPDN
jgi:thiol:disulfide interchange protein DsbD